MNRNKRLRPIAAPFVAAPPAGARVRTRLRVTEAESVVLRAVGEYLGSVASADLARRCAEGPLDAKGKAASRRTRKKELTAATSSRWAGAITRTSEDGYGLAQRNLQAEIQSLEARVRTIKGRAGAPVAGKEGRVTGYRSVAERRSKIQRLQVLETRLRYADGQLTSG